MNIKYPKHFITGAAGLGLVVTLVAANALAQTPETRRNPHRRAEVRAGLPHRRDHAKSLRRDGLPAAVQAYLWAYPAVSFESIRIGVKRDLGLDYNEFTIADKLADAKSVWLTANDSTVYALTLVDLGKSGPMVVDVPPGAIVGLIDDYWQRSLTDLGLPGPDGDKGGKFLLLPPGYKGEVPEGRLPRPAGDDERLQRHGPRHRGEGRLRRCGAGRQQDECLPVE